MKRLFGWFNAYREIRKNDPVKSCDLYKQEGCSHVDGFLCDIKTCTSLKQYRNENIHCPVCGYYCLGKGGVGCIDKPTLCGYDIKPLDSTVLI